MDVSIVFVNYKTSHLILDSVKSIIENTEKISYEIIIVDNDSEKNLEKNFSHLNLQDSLLRIVYLDKNFGFGAGNNAGAKIANGKYLFFLNPDTVLINNAIKILFDFMEITPKAGACGGNLYNINHQPIFSFRKVLPGVRWEFQELSNHIFNSPFQPIKRFHNVNNRPIKVGYITGADLMVKAEIFNKCGGFDEDFFMYWDDVELCRRIKQLGYEIFNVPEAKIIHLESQSFEVINEKDYKIELMEKYRLLYLKKNVGKLAFFMSNLFYTIFINSRILFIPNGDKKTFYKKKRIYYKKFKKKGIIDKLF